MILTNQKGKKQQENENDVQAIAAFVESIKQAPGHHDAYIPLSVSYANESQKQLAYNTLAQYIKHHPKHSQHYSPSQVDLDTHQNCIEMFEKCEKDANILVGLGVLHHMSMNYPASIIAFKEALIVSPNVFD